MRIQTKGKDAGRVQYAMQGGTPNVIFFCSGTFVFASVPRCLPEGMTLEWVHRKEKLSGNAYAKMRFKVFILVPPFGLRFQPRLPAQFQCCMACPRTGAYQHSTLKLWGRARQMLRRSRWRAVGLSSSTNVGVMPASVRTRVECSIPDNSS